MNSRVRAYSYALGLLFWSPLVAALTLQRIPLLPLAPFLALALVGEELVVLQRQRAGENTVSFSAAAHVAAAIVLGPTPAALIAAVAVVIVDGLRRERLPYIVVNSAMFGGAIWIAGTLYVSLSSSLGMRVLPALLLLVVVRYLISSAVFAGGTALATGSRFGYVFRTAVLEELGSAIGEGSLGVLLAVAVVRHDWILLPFLVPLLAALYRSKTTLARLQAETDAALKSIASVIDERDPSTAAHSDRVAEYVTQFVHALGLPRREADRLIAAARLHDLGKIVVDVATLSKPGRLSEAEMRIIRSHPRLSAQLLAPFQFARELAGFVELHHERYDGRGYFAVPGGEVPIEAHVLIVADSFDAMTSARPYRPALSLEDAALELEDKAGTQFHPQVASVFAALVRGLPVEETLGHEALGELRRLFTPVPVFDLPPASSLRQPRMAALVCAVVALGGAGIGQLPLLITVLSAFAAAAFATTSLAVDLRRKRRLMRAEQALASGSPPSLALAAAGLKAWSAWLAPHQEDGSYELLVSDLGSSPEQISEIRRWAVRRAGQTEEPLASGEWLILSEPGPEQVRLGVVLAKRPSPSDREITCGLIRRALEMPSQARPQRQIEATDERRRESPVSGLPVILEVELDIFESIRRSAGQLVAERVIADVEERLRKVLRPADVVVRLGDDRFAVAFHAEDGNAVARIRDRIRSELGCVRLPRRVQRLEPRISSGGKTGRSLLARHLALAHADGRVA
jgi:GGDEF domain-containing protein